jgi:hypothetical protein
MKRTTQLRIVLTLAAFLAALVGTVLVVREPTVVLTPERLRDARERWSSASIADYDSRYRMHGAEYAVRVRAGIVTEVVADGRVTYPADAGAYGMNGLFDLLAMELENVSDPEGPFAGPRESIVMRVRFHPVLGYVERYLRSGGGTRPAAIELIEFSMVQ